MGLLLGAGLLLSAPVTVPEASISRIKGDSKFGRDVQKQTRHWTPNVTALVEKDD